MKTCGKQGCTAEVHKSYDRYCRGCRSAYTSKWQKANRGKMRATAQNHRANRRNCGGCAACKLPVCTHSAVYCLLHYLADRAHKALGVGTIKNAKLLQVAFERQGGKCPYTGRTLTYGMAEIDHVVPRAQGGTSGVDNLEWVHPDVNRAKAALGRGEFLALCAEVTARSPRLKTDVENG